MIKTQVDASRVLSTFGKLPVAIRFQFGDALDHISLKFLKKFRDERLSGGEGVKARPGGLFRQFKRVFMIPSETQSMGVEIFTYSTIAKLHEEGGVMRGTGGLRLAVPISASASTTETSSGAVRAQFGGTPYNRDVRPKKNVMPVNVGGQTYLFRRRRKAEDILPPLFVLKEQVTLKPRLGFYKTWKDLEPEAIQIVSDALTKAARDAVS